MTIKKGLYRVTHYDGMFTTMNGYLYCEPYNAIIEVVQVTKKKVVTAENGWGHSWNPENFLERTEPVTQKSLF
jgi:hypothetical protein